MKLLSGISKLLLNAWLMSIIINAAKESSKRYMSSLLLYKHMNYMYCLLINAVIIFSYAIKRKDGTDRVATANR